jgi:hypothetical protein
LTALPSTYAICRLAGEAPIPAWLDRGGFHALVRTSDELSLVCREDAVPEDVKSERGFRAIRVRGPLAFDETGVLASLAGPLAEAGISLFAISTFDTDYVLVKQARLRDAVAALTAAGHRFEASDDE